MVYSNTPVLQKESEFPPPPMFLTWVRNYDYRSHMSATGTVRHHDSLKASRRYIGRYTNGRGWYQDWALYEWNGKKYIKIHEGFQGDPKIDHPLFKTPLKGGQAPAREADEDEVAAVIASILAGSQ